MVFGYRDFTFHIAFIANLLDEQNQAKIVYERGTTYEGKYNNSIS